jgi:hypothetical protein
MKTKIVKMLRTSVIFKLLTRWTSMEVTARSIELVKLSTTMMRTTFLVRIIKVEHTYF